MKRAKGKKVKKPKFIVINDIGRNVSEQTLKEFTSRLARGFLLDKNVKKQIVNEGDLAKRTITKIKKINVKFDKVFLMTRGGLMFAEEVARQGLAPKDKIRIIDVSMHSKKKQKTYEMIKKSLKKGEKILLLDDMVGWYIGIDRMGQIKGKLERSVGKGNVTMAAGVVKKPLLPAQKETAKKIVHVYESKAGIRASEALEKSYLIQHSSELSELEKALNKKRMHEGEIQW